MKHYINAAEINQPNVAVAVAEPMEIVPDTSLCHGCGDLVNQDQPCPTCGAVFDNSVVVNVIPVRRKPRPPTPVKEVERAQTFVHAKTMRTTYAKKSIRTALAQVHRQEGDFPAAYVIEEVSKNPEKYGAKFKNLIDHPRPEPEKVHVSRACYMILWKNFSKDQYNFMIKEFNSAVAKSLGIRVSST